MNLMSGQFCTFIEGVYFNSAQKQTFQLTIVLSIFHQNTKLVYAKLITLIRPISASKHPKNFTVSPRAKRSRKHYVRDIRTSIISDSRAWCPQLPTKIPKNPQDVRQRPLPVAFPPGRRDTAEAGRNWQPWQWFLSAVVNNPNHMSLI